MPDWDALETLFAQPRVRIDGETSSAEVDVFVSYLGETMPKWLARDLMTERAAIREYDGCMTREESETVNEIRVRRNC